MFAQGDNNQKTDNIFIRLLFVLVYILIPIGAFLFPPFIFTLLIYHKQVIMSGILEFLFLIVPILFVTFARPKRDMRFWIFFRLFIFGLFLFAIFFAVLFVKILPALLGAMG